MKIGMRNKISGMCGEDAACCYLKKNRHKIIERNCRNRYGEIDIIARCGEDIVFVEVKTRSSDKFGTPAEAVTYYKKQRIVRAAMKYISENGIDLNVRFDIIEVYGMFDGDTFHAEKINHLKNVFTEV